MPDYDFYHGLYSGQQVDSAVSRALVGGQLDQDIAAIRAAVGSPLVATTAAEMTNINKIYVYTGSEAGYSTGHWYYYENGSWQDGGLYNSAAADDEMSDSSTNAVQNKVIKEYVDTTASDLSGDIGDVRTDLGTEIYAEQTRAEGVEALKAPLASPALTGTPTAPTAAAGTSSTQIATTAYADNAVAAEKARAEAVEATKADKSYADYILLREEEDRQILFGSVVEAAEDSYPELRSAPIHNAITIGQSVYPRMDRTRMAIDAIKGRTVAFNQLIQNGDFSDGTTGWNTYGGSDSAADNVATVVAAATGTLNVEFYRSLPVAVNTDHVIFCTMELNSEVNTGARFRSPILTPKVSLAANTWTRVAAISKANGVPNAFNIQFDGTSGKTLKVRNVWATDLTAEYGTTIADAILAMETAQTGAGVAYVRQRLDLDYYASNAGELKAPVVSGVGFVGFNLWDEEWENGSINGETGQNTVNPSSIRSKNYIPVINGAEYYFAVLNYPTFSTYGWFLCQYDADKNFLGRSQKYGHLFNPDSSCAFIRFVVPSAYGNVYLNDICINLSSSRNGEYQPYQHTSLAIPSTRLDGVGTAQDYIECVEVGENDYSLHLHKVMGEVDLGTLTWEYRESDKPNKFFRASVPTAKTYNNTDGNKNIITPRYVWANGYAMLNNSGYDKVVNLGTNNLIANNTYLCIIDSAYSDAAAFKTAVTGQMLAFELATPTETVIAEHLTLADISAIAENGGIISIVNENGHIVQPDGVFDTVISRSAS